MSPPIANSLRSLRLGEPQALRILTLNALHNLAQGRERSERTLGQHHPHPSTLKGLHKAGPNEITVRDLVAFGMN